MPQDARLHLGFVRPGGRALGPGSLETDSEALHFTPKDGERETLRRDQIALVDLLTAKIGTKTQQVVVVERKDGGPRWGIAADGDRYDALLEDLARHRREPVAASGRPPLLEIRSLSVQFDTEDGVVQAVDGVSYSVQAGKTLGIVGESGSGKSVSSQTVMGLTSASNATIVGEILFEGRNLLAMSEKELRAVRGNDIAMIFQDPLSSLHPFYKVGKQIAEAVRIHNDVSKAQAWDRAVEMLGLVGIPEPRKRADSYPHEFSGGMRQRAMIAMALANNPKLLIADEPTTALDVTVQAQILDLIERLQAEFDAAVVIITHDLGVVAEVADDIAVMYAGQIVERATADTIFHAPEHPYTWGLLGSIPKLDAGRGEELVPISGRPPSLINLPGGCSFHPRCPYVREAHTRVEPRLEAVNGGDHHVSCLLDSGVRRKIWADLRQGESPEQVRAEEIGEPVPKEAIDE